MAQREQNNKFFGMALAIRIFAVLLVIICVINTFSLEGLLHDLFASSIALQVGAVLTILLLSTFGLGNLINRLAGTMADMERSIGDRLSRQVNVDGLTGLHNYRFLQEELKRKTKDERDDPFTLMVMGLDHLRYYSEARGPQAGERLITEAAANIVHTVGEPGQVFRFGRDEFAIIIDHGDQKKALTLAEEIRRNIKDNFTIAEQDNYWEHDLTASLGLAFYPADGSTGEELINKAEQALCRAKMISGNNVETYFSVLEFLRAQIDASEGEAFNKLTAFLAIINARDHYTYGHSERVLIYASIIASLIEMPPPAKKYLQYGAYLHDIGKIEIDRSILNNPGNLDHAEWEIIFKHPLRGADIVRQIKALHHAVPAILYHHERYDGNGYPFNLPGKKIPLEGRIIALADSFDAMTVQRPYKKAISYAEAIKELERNRQLQFDPVLVDLFTEFLRQYQSVDQLLALQVKERYLL